MNDFLARGVAENLAPGRAAAILPTGGQILVARTGVKGLDNLTALTLNAIFYIAPCNMPVTSVAALQQMREQHPSERKAR